MAKHNKYFETLPGRSNEPTALGEKKEEDDGKSCPLRCLYMRAQMDLTERMGVSPDCSNRLGGDGNWFLGKGKKPLPLPASDDGGGREGKDVERNSRSSDWGPLTEPRSITEFFPYRKTL